VIPKIRSDDGRLYGAFVFVGRPGLRM